MALVVGVHERTDQVRKTRMMGGGWLLSSACTNERVVDTTTTRHTQPPNTKQLAMLREADMYKLWMPFMVQSNIVREVNKTELVFHSTVAVPWIATRCVASFVLHLTCWMRMIGCASSSIRSAVDLNNNRCLPQLNPPRCQMLNNEYAATPSFTYSRATTPSGGSSSSVASRCLNPKGGTRPPQTTTTTTRRRTTGGPVRYGAASPA